MHVDELRPEREEHLSLTMLPLDVLHTILLQRGIGARELCALESTCLMFRQLVDEAAMALANVGTLFGVYPNYWVFHQRHHSHLGAYPLLEARERAAKGPHSICPMILILIAIKPDLT